MVDGISLSNTIYSKRSKLRNFYASFHTSILLILTSMTLVGCLPSLDFTPAPEPPPVSLFSQTLDVRVTDAELTKLNPPGINSRQVGATMNLFVGFDVINSAEVFVSLRDLDYSVYLAGYEVDRNRLSSDRLGITEGSVQHFEFPINLNIQDNPELLNQALQILAGTPVDMRVIVEATTEDDLRQNLQAVRTTTSSAAIVAPDISMLDMRLLNPQQLSLKLQAENTGGVGYILNSQRLNLRQNILSVARADIFNVQVPAQATTVFDVIFELDDMFDATGEIAIATDWLFDVLGAGNFTIEDWFLRTKL